MITGGKVERGAVKEQMGLILTDDQICALEG